MKIRNKVIAITGSGQGLGRQFAIDCALKGARLALLDLNYDKVKKVAGECIELGAEANYYKMDVTSENDVKECYGQIVKDFGSLHASINNAGILRDGLLIKEKNGEISTFPLRKWQEVIDTNLTGVFLCGREAAFNMVKLKIRGVIINISSLSYHGNLGQTNYSAAKAGVCSLTVLWAKELAKSNTPASSATLLISIEVAKFAPNLQYFPNGTRASLSAPPKISRFFLLGRE